MPLCKNNANVPRNENKIPTMNKIQKPFIRVDHDNVVASFI